MNISAETIKNEALMLSRVDRSRLVVNLLQSIDERSCSESNETAWIAEADRRYRAYLAGEERAISAEEVFQELRAEDR